MAENAHRCVVPKRAGHFSLCACRYDRRTLRTVGHLSLTATNREDTVIATGVFGLVREARAGPFLPIARHRLSDGGAERLDGIGFLSCTDGGTSASVHGDRRHP